MSPKTTKRKTAKPKDPYQAKPTVAMAKQGHELATLLWQKILASSTPEIQEAMKIYDNLAYIWDQMAPTEFDKVMHPNLTHDELMDNMVKAEYLLTGFHIGDDVGLPEGYENRKPKSARDSDKEGSLNNA